MTPPPPEARLMQVRETEGAWEVLTSYGSEGETWEPLGEWYARHRLLAEDVPGAPYDRTLLDLLEAEGWVREAELRELQEQAEKDGAAIEWANRRIRELQDALHLAQTCDCVPDEFSSRVCPKCGRRAVSN